LANRGRILSALYTLLLANPCFKRGGNKQQAPTRFKTWWKLVGAPIEHIAKLNGIECSFEDMFVQSEELDEEQGETIGGLLALETLFQDREFTAGDVFETLRKGSSEGEGIREASKNTLALQGELVSRSVSTWLARLRDAPFEVADEHGRRVLTVKTAGKQGGSKHHEIKRFHLKGAAF
jgi:hypothetical protein